jgi:hypothetical protein
VFLIVFSSQAQEEICSRIALAFQKADVSKILAQTTEQILITIGQKNVVYSKSQAEMVLKDFFEKNPPKSFKYIFRDNTNTMKCVVATLQTDKQNFSILLAFKKENTEYLLSQLTIEKK